MPTLVIARPWRFVYSLTLFVLAWLYSDWVGIVLVGLALLDLSKK